MRKRIRLDAEVPGIVRLLLDVAFLALAATIVSAASKPFDTATASFAVSFHGATSAYRDAAIALLPNQRTSIEAVGGPPGDYGASSEDGDIVPRGARAWVYTAPNRPGTYRIRVSGAAKHDAIDLHVFVMVPASHVTGGVLNGYRIGRYPPPRAGNRRYAPPPGFIEVTRDNRDTKVSPHFTLGQFVCKEDATGEFPKYVVLDEKLPPTLEAVLERVNRAGFDVDTLHLMSAYRTPFYNRAIGDVRYSMHQWGSAADIYVDAQKNDRMVDLNRDGRVDVDDAKYLYDAIDQLRAGADVRWPQGGLGYYPPTASHPPFVHVDVRGAAARWKG